MPDDENSSLPEERTFEDGALYELALQYVNECYADVGEEEKKKSKKIVGDRKSVRFPNMAGFCRYIGIGHSELERIMRDYPREYGMVCAVFEDEAFNSDVSPSILTAYLKQRLGYGEKSDTKSSKYEDSDIRLVFEHDIYEDGG